MNAPVISLKMDVVITVVSEGLDDLGDRRRAAELTCTQQTGGHTQWSVFTYS